MRARRGGPWTAGFLLWLMTGTWEECPSRQESTLAFSLDSQRKALPSLRATPQLLGY